MPRPISKKKQDEAKMIELEDRIKVMNTLVIASKIRELDFEVKYHQEQLNFATHKLNNAKENFVDIMEKRNENAEV